MATIGLDHNELCALIRGVSCVYPRPWLNGCAIAHHAFIHNGISTSNVLLYVVCNLDDGTRSVVSG